VAEAEAGQAAVHTRAEVHTRAVVHTRAEADTQAEADTSAHPAGACSRAAAEGKAHSGSIFGPTAPLDAIPAGKDMAHRCST
jgi:hypothetical protein